MRSSGALRHGIDDCPSQRPVTYSAKFAAAKKIRHVRTICRAQSSCNKRPTE
jgi:hypothetical protein